MSSRRAWMYCSSPLFGVRITLQIEILLSPFLDQVLQVDGILGVDKPPARRRGAWGRVGGPPDVNEFQDTVLFDSRRCSTEQHIRRKRSPRLHSMFSS